MIGAQILIESLKREGVQVIFGYPGGQVLPIFDKIYDSDIRFILTRHEQGAAHAADGYARATGKAGVCLATSGPGATNLVTGIGDAMLDSVPIVAITQQGSLRRRTSGEKSAGGQESRCGLKSSERRPPARLDRVPARDQFAPDRRSALRALAGKRF